MKSLRYLLFTLTLLAASTAVIAAPGKSVPKIPVVFVTDIGTDIDDTWALAMLLRCPELDLKLVLTDSNDTQHRALVAAKFLEARGIEMRIVKIAEK